MSSLKLCRSVSPRVKLSYVSSELKPSFVTSRRTFLKSSLSLFLVPANNHRCNREGTEFQKLFKKFCADRTIKFDSLLGALMTSFEANKALSAGAMCDQEVT